VDPEARTVEIYTGGAEGQRLHARYGAGDIMTSALFPGLEIPLREIFEG
jgi:hypothetical protein